MGTSKVNAVYGFTKQHTLNEWQHLCVTWSGGNSIKFYCDGGLQHTEASSLVQVNAKHIVVGQDVDGGSSTCIINDRNQGFMGDISMVNIWKQELNAAEVNQVYNGEFGQGDVANWETLLQFTETNDISKKIVDKRQ